METKSPAGGFKGRRYIVQCMDFDVMRQVLLTMQKERLSMEGPIGPELEPHTVVVWMNDDEARALKARFQGMPNLTIEPDQPLSPFGTSIVKGN